MKTIYNCLTNTSRTCFLEEKNIADPPPIVVYTSNYQCLPHTINVSIQYNNAIQYLFVWVHTYVIMSLYRNHADIFARRLFIHVSSPGTHFYS